jgi:ATP-dependent RNA helicase SUPV3L1/SUV3
LMRRLRENAVMEPQINKTGEVVVEGHSIGRLDGFTFIADASSGGSEAKALHNAAQKALAGEIASRASRLTAAPDDQFALAADGAVRWTGAAVGKLIAGEQPLRPRVRVIADEHLTGAPRDAVEARLDLFVKSHLEKLLGPLFDLAAAEDVTGIARGVAFQLVEAFGVLDRARVAEEVKGLEQPARASLRKYGVRFGAYHIYIPALLKPAPRALAVQLFALAHEGPQTKGLDDVLHLAGSGRTSLPVNRDVDTVLYRTAGYRICGERVVRADILERLADLIRPALAWREGGAAAKPAGAVVGGGFTVVNGMTSLIGASGEDFASVLRSLGYRMQLRPKPADPSPAAGVSAAAVEAPEQADAAAIATETLAPTSAEAAEPVAADDDVSAVDAATDADAADAAVVEAASEPAPDVVAADATEAAPVDAGDAGGHESGVAEVEAQATEVESQIAEVEAQAAEVEAQVTEVESQDRLVEANGVPAPESGAETSTAASPEAAGAASSEPEMIEVWRPGRAGRPEGRHRPRFKRRDTDRRSEAAPPATAGATALTVAADGAAVPSEDRTAASGRPERREQHRRRGGGGERHGSERHGGERHGERRFDRPPRDRERGPGKPVRFERREREKAPDPNSPFAKLAALKAQLEAEAKERQ